MDDFPRWPAWFYGPNGEAEVFEGEADVPEGWEDSPAKVAAAIPAEAVDLVAAIPEAAEIVGDVIAKRGPGRPRKVAD